MVRPNLMLFNPLMSEIHLICIQEGQLKTEHRHTARINLAIRKEKSNKMQRCIKISIILYLYEAQHVSGDTPPIIRSLKLHWQPLVFHTWKVVGRVVGGCCQAQWLPVQF
jgi:hypothetical protein